MLNTLRDIVAAYGSATQEGLCTVLVLAAAPPFFLFVSRWLSPAAARFDLGLLASLAVSTGVVLSFDRASAFDDAFISFRYAQNLVEGHGLVFNPGERVEGYTNFLWTLLLAGVYAVTRLELPLIGVILAFASYLANLGVVYCISRRLTPREHLWLPLALGLFAVQNISTSYATTGLETHFASFCVNVGALQLLQRPSIKTRLLAGLALILATLSRPDHAIFYAAGAVVVAIEDLSTAKALREASWLRRAASVLPTVTAYAAPFVLYIAHMAFRALYYGETLPNTYYAKVAYEPYYTQGVIYAADFYLASHAWVLVPLWVWYVGWGPRQALGFRLFMAVSVPLYNFYVVRVGGDFMHGRFFLVLLPLYLLSAEQTVHMLLTRGRKALAVACASLMLATGFGMRLQGEHEIRWHIADETTYYRIVSWFPIVVDHYNYNVGRLLQHIAGAGVHPKVATTSVGMVGYYSGLVVIDKYGLTDHTIARSPTAGRGRPGHERRKVNRYLHERGVHIARHERPAKRYRSLLRIELGEDTGGGHWYWLHYDHELAQALRAAAPEVRFVDLREHIERFIRRLEQGQRPSSESLRRDLDFFDYHYFASGRDRGLRSRLVAAVGALQNGR